MGREISVLEKIVFRYLTRIIVPDHTRKVTVSVIFNSPCSLQVANLKNSMQNQEVYNTPNLTTVLQHTRNVIDDLREADRDRMLEVVSIAVILKPI